MIIYSYCRLMIYPHHPSNNTPTVARAAHDSLTALATDEDRIEISNLVVSFLKKVGGQFISYFCWGEGWDVSGRNGDCHWTQIDPPSQVTISDRDASLSFLVEVRKSFSNLEVVLEHAIYGKSGLWYFHISSCVCLGAV